MKNENILVVKTSTLFPHGAFQGLSTHTQEMLDLINEHKEFNPRHIMEEDFSYKQIIPYLIFKYQDQYFLMQRAATSSEQRLKNKYTLGIGGHMRQEDMNEGATIFDWAKREFEEEIDYAGHFSIKTVGVLNDDSNPVGQVHVGLVLLLEGTSPEIKVRSELKSGKLMSPAECLELYQDLESWSQIVFDGLIRSTIPVSTSTTDQLRV